MSAVAMSAVRFRVAGVHAHAAGNAWETAPHRHVFHVEAWVGAAPDSFAPTIPSLRAAARELFALLGAPVEPPPVAGTLASADDLVDFGAQECAELAERLADALRAAMPDGLTRRVVAVVLEDGECGAVADLAPLALLSQEPAP